MQVWLLLLRRLDSVNQLVNSLTSISLHELCLKLLPEEVALIGIEVILQRNAAQRQHRE